MLDPLAEIQMPIWPVYSLNATERGWVHSAGFTQSRMANIALSYEPPDSTQASCIYIQPQGSGYISIGGAFDWLQGNHLDALDLHATRLLFEQQLGDLERHRSHVTIGQTAIEAQMYRQGQKSVVVAEIGGIQLAVVHSHQPSSQLNLVELVTLEPLLKQRTEYLEAM